MRTCELNCDTQCPETGINCTACFGLASVSTDALVKVLATRPLTETLPLVKEWLAGEGYGVAEAGPVQDDCPFGCKFCKDHGVNDFSCGLGAGMKRDFTLYPDPTKCPAMLKRAKEGK